MHSLTAIFFISLIALLLFFAGVYWICRCVKNAGFVDAAWAFSFLFLVVSFAFFTDGFWLRKLAISVMGGLWSLRLGVYLLRRVWKHHPQEDPRYVELRKAWTSHRDLKFFGFFEAQALLVAAFIIPFLLICANPSPKFAVSEISGALLWLLAFFGEALADLQMAKFKANAANRHRVCNVRLWRYSRHPNYFFESLIWWSYFLFALGSPHGWLTIYCPLLMLFFLLRITGVPLAEAQSLRSKGAAYREYQRTTNKFIPWFPKQ